MDALVRRFLGMRDAKLAAMTVVTLLAIVGLVFMAGSAAATPCHGCPDDGGGSGSTPPTISANISSVVVSEGGTAANSGAFGDVDSNGTVTITASVGEITKTGASSGTWDWNFATNDGHAQSQQVAITATDSTGETASASFSLTVNNVAPTATFNRTTPVNEGSFFNISLTNPNDPSSADRNAGFTYAFDCGDGSGSGGFFTSGGNRACPTSDNGTRTVGARIRDKDGGITQYGGPVVVNNVAPTATFNAPESVDEGGSFDISLTNPSDPSSADTSAGLTYAFDCGNGYGVFGGSSVSSCQARDGATRTVKGKIKDKDNGETEYTRTVAVNDVTPANTTITSGPSGLARNTGATFEWSGTDNRTPAAELDYSYKLDNGEWSFYSSDTDVVLNGLSQGSHTLQVKAKDAAGNVDASPASRSWKVDTVAPRGSVKINNGAAKTTSLRVRLNLSASDPTSGVARMCVSNTPRCSAWQPFAKGKVWRLSGNRAGVKAVYVKYQDRAGNVSRSFKDTIRYAPKKRR